MKKQTKAKSMQTMVEAKTERAIIAIAGIGAAVSAKNGPFEEGWAMQVCEALRKSVDKLETELMEQHKLRKPFRLCNPISCSEENKEV